LEPANIQQIGKYQVTEVLGRGGMGIVYRAQDKRMGRPVAIKTLTEGYMKDPGMLERFYQEAEKTGMLKHANIVTVYDLGEQDGMPYIVMEYVEGTPLDRIIRESHPVPLVYKLKIIEQVCHALGYAHQAGVVHRDVKPANVIVQPDGVAKLLDFGIARLERSGKIAGLTLTLPGNVIGTLPYMAPERLQGVRSDGRSDIFATGVLLYQLITGELPFSGEEIVLVKKLLNDRPRPLRDFLESYPEILDRIVDQALAKDPDGRYSNAEEMATDLSRAVEELKREQVEEMIRDATRRTSQQDFLGAKSVLDRLLQIDTQNTDARRLLAEVKQRLTERHRIEQAQRLRAEYEEAMADRNYTEAIAAMEQACRLQPADTSLSELLQGARRTQQKSEQIDNYLRQAETARRSGDLAAAQAIVAKGLELDKENSKLRAAYSLLVRKAQEAAEHARAKKLIEAARNELQQRHFERGLELLKEAEGIDPSDEDLQKLLQAAQIGIRQRERRLLLDRIEAQLAAGMTLEEMEAALRSVDAALERSPSDATLLRCRLELDRHMGEEKARNAIENTVRVCRMKMESSPTEALELVRAQLKETPGNERLLTLKTRIEERVARLSLEQRRASLLQQARQALQTSEYAKAARILEDCPAEILSPEIADLLQYARHEGARSEHQSLVSGRLQEVHALLERGEHEAAIAILEPLARDSDEISLRDLFEHACRLRDTAGGSAPDVYRRAEALIEHERYEEAARMLEADPDTLATMRGQELCQRAHSEGGREAELLRRVGAAYAAMEGVCVPPGWAETRSLLRACRHQGVFSRIHALLTARVAGKVDQRLSGEMRTIRADLRAGEAADAAKALAESAPLADFASGEIAGEWKRLTEQVNSEASKSRFRRALGT
jgi:serine/threonine-protein kinase